MEIIGSNISIDFSNLTAEKKKYHKLKKLETIEDIMKYLDDNLIEPPEDLNEFTPCFFATEPEYMNEYEFQTMIKRLRLQSRAVKIIYLLEKLPDEKQESTQRKTIKISIPEIGSMEYIMFAEFEYAKAFTRQSLGWIADIDYKQAECLANCKQDRCEIKT